LCPGWQGHKGRLYLKKQPKQKGGLGYGSSDRELALQAPSPEVKFQYSTLPQKKKKGEREKMESH
jgi:hypothetical protein